MTESVTEQGFLHKILNRFTDESIDALDASHAQFFERLIPGMRPEHANRYVFAAQKLKEMQRLNPVVVDAATGQGYGTKILKEAVPEAKIIGIDLNPTTILSAKRKYGGYGEYTQADVRHIPVMNAGADMVTAFETLEHLPIEDQPVFLRELTRIVKPDGLIVLSVPYPSSTYKGKDNVVRHGFGSGSHLYEPPREEARQMLQNAGLEILGEYGQVITDSRQAKAASIVNRILPIWGIYAWLGRKDHRVQPMPDSQTKTSLIHVFVARPAV